MQYTPEIGKIYDTIFYCIEYFNEETIKIEFSDILDGNTSMEERYLEIKKKIPALPSILKPIFLSSRRKPSAMTAFLDEEIAFEKDTIETFLAKIVTASNNLLDKIIEVIFPNEKNLNHTAISPLTSPEKYIEELTESEYSDDFKLQISLLFGNFNYAITELIKVLRSVYIQVNLLHQECSISRIFAFEQLKTARNADLYNQLYKVDILSDDRPVFVTVSLLNQYIIKAQLKYGNYETFIGIKYEETLNFYFDAMSIDLRQILIAVGNDIRLSIIDCLLAENELTVASLSKRLQLPPTTVLRHVEVLYNGKIIFISRKSGLQIFYRLNRKLFIKAAKMVNYKLGGQNIGETNYQLQGSI